jgi:tRNA (guanine-N7-)-methyltransferase
MGRRALRSIDPSLDLSRHLLGFDDLPQPWDAAPVFGRKSPLEVEIGTGKGLFILQAAESTPDHDFFGIEVSAKYARFAAAKLAKRELANGRVAHCDGLRVFRELLPDESVRAVHVYFPDPWWKKRHHKRRVMNPTFVRDIERVLEASGRLHFWTDVKDYFDESLQVLADTTSLDGPLQVVQREAEHLMDYRTHFERRVRMHDKLVYRAEYEKVLRRDAEAQD